MKYLNCSNPFEEAEIAMSAEQLANFVQEQRAAAAAEARERALEEVASRYQNSGLVLPGPVIAADIRALMKGGGR